MLGTYALSAGYYDAFYLKAQQVRTIIRREFDTAFEEFDAIVSATSPTTAFRLGEKTQDPLRMYLSDVLTLPGEHSRNPRHVGTRPGCPKTGCQSASRSWPSRSVSRRYSGSRTPSSRRLQLLTAKDLRSL